MIKAGVGALRVGVLWHLVHIPAHILARNPFFDPSRYQGVDSFEFTGLDFLSPGGGGPGQSLTSTNPPPSVEEVGRIITSPGNPWDAATGPSHGAGRKAGGPRKSLQRGSRPRRKCKPGHYWNGRKCVRIPEKGWRDFSRKYD